MKRQPHRPRLLNDDQEVVLENRIALAQILEFTLTDLGEGWGLSKATLFRYKSPEYRAESVEAGRRVYLSYRKSIARGVCARCQEGLEHHARCKDCEILLHAGSLFGDTDDGITCTGCFDTRERQIMRMFADYE